MEATKKVRPEPGEKPYEFMWRLHYGDHTVVPQYDEHGHVVLFAKQSLSGLVAVSVFRHPMYEPEWALPNSREVVRYALPIFVECRDVDIRYQGRAVKRDGEIIYLPRRRMVVATDWCNVYITPKGWLLKEVSEPGESYEVSIKRKGR